MAKLSDKYILIQCELRPTFDFQQEILSHGDEHAISLLEKLGAVGTIWEHLKKNKRSNCLKIKQLLLFVVPGAGVEPAQPRGHWCLRPARLPIPPSGQSDLFRDLQTFEVHECE